MARVTIAFQIHPGASKKRDETRKKAALLVQTLTRRTQLNTNQGEQYKRQCQEDFFDPCRREAQTQNLLCPPTSLVFLQILPRLTEREGFLEL